MENKNCVNCGKNSDLIPLISLDYKGKSFAICPQCLPVLIHKPGQLADKLPGLDNVTPAAHSH